jgi:hypothetical protein
MSLTALTGSNAIDESLRKDGIAARNNIDILALEYENSGMVRHLSTRCMFSMNIIAICGHRPPFSGK